MSGFELTMLDSPVEHLTIEPQLHYTSEQIHCHVTSSKTCVIVYALHFTIHLSKLLVSMYMHKCQYVIYIHICNI